MLLAIETSCDETALAVLDAETKVAGIKADLVSSQVALHRPYGGVVPEIAAREHIRVLPWLYKQAFEQSGASVGSLEAIVVTQGPGLKGCLLVGLSFAKALAFSTGIPLIPVNHLEGHLFAFELLEEADNVEYPLLALVVSGGHTMLVLVRSFRDYLVVANTRDDAAGEAFDKTATLLGLPYPGGPALSKTATGGDRAAFSFPVSLPNELSAFSFSGLKTAVLREVEKLGPEALGDQTLLKNLAASVEWAIVNNLLHKTELALEQYPVRTVILTGGVAANGCLRQRMKDLAGSRGLNFLVPPHKWCTDNAAMIGVVGRKIFRSSKERYHNWDLKGEGFNLLGPDAVIDCAAYARWPLAEMSQAVL